MIAPILCVLVLDLFAVEASVSVPQTPDEASPRPIERDAAAGAPDAGSGTPLRRLAAKLALLDQASEADLREIEQAIVGTLGIPSTWKVDFTRSGNIVTPVQPMGDATMVTARLSHHRLGGTPMRLSTTLDGGWVVAGSTLFVASDARTAFERAELKIRTGFLEPSALAPMLEALDRELTCGLEEGSTL
jgi:hypothetical protein